VLVQADSGVVTRIDREKCLSNLKHLIKHSLAVFQINWEVTTSTTHWGLKMSPTIAFLRCCLTQGRASVTATACVTSPLPSPCMALFADSPLPWSNAWDTEKSGYWKEPPEGAEDATP
jgi:hypothetical protein